MKRTILSVILGLLASSVQATEPVRSLTIITIDGGSMVTPLAYDIAVNKGSSLRRRWVVLNDPTCPIKLGNIGVVPVYKSERYSGSYSFVVKGEATAVQDITAFRIVFTQFDVWGNRDRGLSVTSVTDIKAGSLLPMGGSWYANENDVEQIFTSVAYVDQVMLPDGKMWRANRTSVASKLSEVQLKVSEAALDPDPPRETPKK